MRPIQITLAAIAASLMAISPAMANRAMVGASAGGNEINFPESPNQAISVGRLSFDSIEDSVIREFEALDKLPGLTNEELVRFKELRRSVEQQMAKGRSTDPKAISQEEYVSIIKQYRDFLFLANKSVDGLESLISFNSRDADFINSSSLILGSVHALMAVGGTMGAFIAFSKMREPTMARSRAGRVFTRVGQAGAGTLAGIVGVLGSLITYGYFNSASKYPNRVREDNQKLIELKTMMETMKLYVDYELNTIQMIIEATK